MVKLKKKENLKCCKDDNLESQQTIQEGYILDKNVRDPEFAQMLCRAKQQIEYLKKNPSKIAEREQELFRNIVDGKVNLRPIDEILNET